MSYPSQGCPSIAVDSSDNVHITWHNGPYNIKYAVRSGGTWTIENVTPGYPKYYNYDPSIALDKDDNVYIFWHGPAQDWGGTYGHRNILYRKKTSAGWEDVVLLTDVGWDQYQPNLLWARWPEIGGTKTNVLSGFAVAWKIKDSLDDLSEGAIYFYGEANEVSEEAGMIAGSLEKSIYPQKQCVRDSQGAIYCVYVKTDLSFAYQVYLAKSTDGGITWTEEPVNSENAAQFYPSIAIDSQDNLHIVWSGWGGPTSPKGMNIHYRKKTSSGWEPREMVTSTNYHQKYPEIVVDSQDNIHIVWYGTGWGANTGNYNIQYRKRTASGWQVQESITDKSVDQKRPKIAVDSHGNVHVVWLGRRWGNNLSLIHI